MMMSANYNSYAILSTICNYYIMMYSASLFIFDFTRKYLIVNNYIIV